MSTSSPREHDLLAGALGDDLRPRVGDRLQLLQALDLLAEALGRLHLEHVGELRGDVVEARSTPKAMAMRRSVPNWLMSRGCSEPFGFSKSRAGPPPALTSRSTISVISRYGSTSAVMRCSSPARSSSAIHSRRSLTGAKAGSVYGREGVLDRLVERHCTSGLPSRDIAFFPQAGLDAKRCALEELLFERLCAKPCIVAKRRAGRQRITALWSAFVASATWPIPSSASPAAATSSSSRDS